MPITPWNTDKTWGGSRVPTFIVGAENDSIAPEANGASHFYPNSAETALAKYIISWLKRFIDNDTRYEQFLCPPPAGSRAIEEWRSTCPHIS